MTLRRPVLTLVSLGLFTQVVRAESLTEQIQRVPGLVNAARVAPDLQVRLVYSSEDNFLGKDIYGDLERCFLHKDAAAMLARASRSLRATRPDLRLLAYDCARPARVQRLMWQLVKGTRSQAYVANPRRGSMHSYGCAVDLTLVDRKGRPLDMGTPFDHAGRRAQPRLERALFLTGKLSPSQWSNRLLLRSVMVGAGFAPLAIEWWHFDCDRADRVRKRYKMIP